MAIDDDGITLALGTLDEIFARAEPMTIMYDLRNAIIPSRKHIGVALDWISQNSHLLGASEKDVALLVRA